MMDQLIKLSDALRAGLHDRFMTVGPHVFVQGAELEVDPYWLNWALFDALDLPRSSQAWQAPEQDGVKAWSRYVRYGATLKLDFSRLPEDWREHCRAMGHLGQHPVRIRVVLHEYSKGPETSGSELPSSYDGHSIVYEKRPRAVASGALQALAARLGVADSGSGYPAISVGRTDPRTAGTLGGILCDPSSGVKYLVSCAHVLGLPPTQAYSPGPHEHQSSQEVGPVRFAQVSALKPPNGADCNLFALPGAGRVDVAVAEWLPGSSSQIIELAGRPRFHAIKSAAKMCSGQEVTFVGKESGLVRAQLGPVTIWQEIEFGDFGDGPAGVRCFGALFELLDLRGDRDTVAVPGDSGSWIFDEQDGLCWWNGMVIARQGKRAYCSYAELMMQSIQAEPGLNQVGLHW